MKYASLVYPAGVAGAALVVLRVAVLLSLVTAAITLPSLPTLAFMAFAIVTLAVGLGVFTRLAAGAAAVLTLQIFIGVCEPTAALSGVLDATALAMLGPGALSIDGLRFGRRTVRLSGDNHPKV